MISAPPSGQLAARGGARFGADCLDSCAGCLRGVIRLCEQWRTRRRLCFCRAPSDFRDCAGNRFAWEVGGKNPRPFCGGYFTAQITAKSRCSNTHSAFENPASSSQFMLSSTVAQRSRSATDGLRSANAEQAYWVIRPVSAPKSSILIFLREGGGFSFNARTADS